MRSGRSALGVIVGVLLGLGVVVLAGPGVGVFSAQYGQFAASSPQPGHGETTMTTSGTPVLVSGSNTTYSVTTTQSSSTISSAQAAPSAFLFGTPVEAQINSIARQPVTQTGVVFIPVLAAFLFGFVVYRVSGARKRKEEAPKTD